MSCQNPAGSLPFQNHHICAESKEVHQCRSSTASRSCTATSRSGAATFTRIRNCSTTCTGPRPRWRRGSGASAATRWSTGIGRTGVVGVIRGNKPATGRIKAIGLRADMDALPIMEATNLPYAVEMPGKHARLRTRRPHGDAARRGALSRRDAQFRRHGGRDFPAGGGGRRRRQGHGPGRHDGPVRIGEVYGMHNYPGLPVGEFAIRSGAICVGRPSHPSISRGVGGHAARPHLSIDPRAGRRAIVTALQTIVSRNDGPARRR